MAFYKRVKESGIPSWISLHKVTKKRIAIWCVAAVICGLFSALVVWNARNCELGYGKFDFYDHSNAVYELSPGSVMQQRFTALGQSVGECSHFYLSAMTDGSAQGQLKLRLYSEQNGETLAETTAALSKLPAYVPEAETLPEQIMLGDGGFYYLNSAREYCLEIVNESETDTVYFYGNAGIQSGKLLIDGQLQNGFLNLSVMRLSLYRASSLLYLLVLITDLTVLLGLALVLFTNVKTHVLYLVLALGFGFVTLFDLTPLYGFDMGFQFDTTYVLSNKMMGLEGVKKVPRQDNPKKKIRAYPRRRGDDISHYQRYYFDEVTANYTDTRAGIREMFASEEDQELIMGETELGFVGEQRYLYLPQAIGFTIARLLGLGLYPMLQIARVLAYAVFVIAMYFSIRGIPFGKRIFMILALTPTVLVQTVSLTRDAMILCMSFWLIANVIRLAYREKKPALWEWLLILVVSALLAPCKMIYLPISCFCLLIVYRQYVRGAEGKWKKIALWAGIGACVLLAMFVLTNLKTILGLFNAKSVSLYGTEGYTLRMILGNPLQTLYLLGNTIRNQMGTYLVNAVQLFEIELGASHGITLIVFFLLMLESFSVDTSDLTLRKEERGFLALVAAGVFLLTAVASIRWTPVTSNVIEGLQGRYLTPALPLLCLVWYNNRRIRLNTDTAEIVGACCCIYPAISLMNMYLWSIGC